MDPRSKALADVMRDVSRLEETLEGFEGELANVSDEPDPVDAEAQRAELRQTIAALQQELSQKRTLLEELSDAGTGCQRRNVNPFNREWVEKTDKP